MKSCVKGLRVKRAIEKLGYNYKFEQTSISYNSYRCVLCFETCTLLSSQEKCRRCGIIICGSCFLKHMTSTVERAKQYGTYPELQCPYCRLSPWFPEFTEFNEFTVRWPASESSSLPHVTIYFEVQGEQEKAILHAIYDDSGVCGYAALRTDSPDASYHVRDLKALQEWSVPLKALKLGLQRAPGSVIYYSGHDQEGFFCHLEDIGVSYKRGPSDFFAVECFEDAIGTKLF
jgi:uncharacterized CHY-type Zn-finger protein